jgi:hypothetical protein
MLDKSMTNVALVGYPRVEEKKEFGYFEITNTEQQCKVLNVRSNLPIRVLFLNIFILLLLGLTTLAVAGLLIKKSVSAPRKTNRPNQNFPLIKDLPRLRLTMSTSSTIKENPLSQERPVQTTKQDISSLTKFIVYITLFSAVLNLPSLLAKSCLMFTINIQPDGPLEIESSWYGIDWTEWQMWFSMLSNKLDFLLLFSSSHKFLIFVFKCNLIKIPTSRFCWIRCNLRNKEEV